MRDVAQKWVQQVTVFGRPLKEQQYLLQVHLTVKQELQGIVSSKIPVQSSADTR